MIDSFQKREKKKEKPKIFLISVAFLLLWIPKKLLPSPLNELIFIILG